MKLYYIANARIPTEKAHGIQIMQMCAAFCRQGADVELWIPRRKNAIREDPFLYYGIETRFPIRQFPVWEAWWLPFGLGYVLVQLSFGYALKRALSSFREPAVIYTRDIWLGKVARALGKRVIWEAHTVTGEARAFRASWGRFSGIISISRGLKEDLIRIFPSARILIAPDGFNADLFQNIPEPSVAKERLGLPRESVIMYTGSTETWKGAHIARDAAKNFKDAVFYFLLVGPPHDIDRFESTCRGVQNIKILRNVPYNELPLWLAAAEVILIPNVPGTAISERHTSPLKLFIAMAAGRPIVASRLPSIEEILNEENSVLVEAGNPEALAEGIRWTLEHREAAKERAARARKDVEGLDWDSRARTILQWMGVYPG